MTAQEIRAVAEIAIQGRWPDLTIILDMPTDQSSARVKPKFVLPFPEKFHPQRAKDRIEQRSQKYHEQVRKNYLAQAKVDPKRYFVVDASKSQATVQEAVYQAISALR